MVLDLIDDVTISVLATMLKIESIFVKYFAARRFNATPQQRR